MVLPTLPLGEVSSHARQSAGEQLGIEALHGLITPEMEAGALWLASFFHTDADGKMTPKNSPLPKINESTKESAEAAADLMATILAAVTTAREGRVAAAAAAAAAAAKPQAPPLPEQAAAAVQAGWGGESMYTARFMEMKAAK